MTVCALSVFSTPSNLEGSAAAVPSKFPGTLKPGNFRFTLPSLMTAPSDRFDPEPAPGKGERPRLKQGYVQVYTGEGKGKTTAAMGLALRALGAGLRVYLGQFIKAGAYSEIHALEKIGGEQLRCRQFGSGKWIRGQPGEEETERARKGLEEVKEVLFSGDYDLVILDEADMAVWFKLFPVEELTGLIDRKPAHVELVFTGRRADERLIERADLVTEMREVKHYYQQGVLARKGIES